jgi:hypothetical protein
VNNSYPTSECPAVSYKDKKKGRVIAENCVVYMTIREGGSKAISFQPALCILMLWTVTTRNFDSWDIFVNEPVEILFVGGISLAANLL